jgi:methionyl-tRNA formyltransferase
VKAFATANGIPVLQPESMKQEGFLAALDEFRADLGIVAAYGKILPRDVIARPRLGTINVHASLLPRWRGAAPVHRAILAGDEETGVTIMRVVEALDAGPMLSRERLAIGPNETSAELEHRLADLGGRLLVETVDRIAAGSVDEEPQPADGVTYASRLERH